MILPVVVDGLIQTNAYFYIDDESKHGFLVDPGAEAGRLLDIIKTRGFVIEKLLITHGHADHIGAVPELQEKLGIPSCMHENGREYAENTEFNLTREFGAPIKLTNVEFLPDGSEITLSANPKFNLKLLHVPGHTTDGAAFYSEKDGVAFVGDTIFHESYGRTDLYGGDESTLLNSIVKKLFTLPDETVLLSGHSGLTTVKEEKTRPWFAGLKA